MLTENDIIWVPLFFLRVEIWFKKKLTINNLIFLSQKGFQYREMMIQPKSDRKNTDHADCLETAEGAMDETEYFTGKHLWKNFWSLQSSAWNLFRWKKKIIDWRNNSNNQFRIPVQTVATIGDWFCARWLAWTAGRLAIKYFFTRYACFAKVGRAVKSFSAFPVFIALFLKNCIFWIRTVSFLKVKVTSVRKIKGFTTYLSKTFSFGWWR